MNREICQKAATWNSPEELEQFLARTGLNPRRSGKSPTDHFPAAPRAAKRPVLATALTTASPTDQARWLREVTGYPEEDLRKAMGHPESEKEE